MKKRMAISKKKSAKDHLTIDASKYNVVDQLANAPSGLTFNQLHRWNASNAERQLTKLLSSRKQKEEHAAGLTIIYVGLAGNEGRAKRRRTRKAARLKLYGTHEYALFNPGAVPNIVSQRLVACLELEPEKTFCSITVASGSESQVVEAVNSVSKSFDNQVVRLDYLVVQHPPFDVIREEPDRSEL